MGEWALGFDGGGSRWRAEWAWRRVGSWRMRLRWKEGALTRVMLCVRCEL